jgi:predicted Rossmann fold nucleotide-binding protein DprA/Smf involved in DNA uptake
VDKVRFLHNTGSAHVPRSDQSLWRRARRARRPARARPPRRRLWSDALCSREDAAAELKAARARGIDFVALGEPDYPSRL